MPGKFEKDPSDAEVRGLVHKEPRKLPPREDLRRHRVRIRDVDIERDRDDQSEDMSLKRSQLAHRVAVRHLRRWAQK